MKQLINTYIIKYEFLLIMYGYCGGKKGKKGKKEGGNK